ncbi:MAG: bifunctional 5,10-methylenetetrahydrofolate dehydrogenase/5,10-methenyltetrahydrofolate cyclohydrolase [Mycoplasmatales bacterium]
MIIDCKEIKASKIEGLKERISKIDHIFTLNIIIVGSNDASSVYVNNKKKFASEIGIECDIVQLPDTIKEEELISKIEDINNDSNIDGLLVQLPLPEHIDESKIINLVEPTKDVDGFSDINMGKLVKNQPCLRPCTAEAVLQIIETTGIELYGKNVVIVGRSNIVGKPLANMLINLGCTVTVCNSKTKNIKDFIDTADIFVSAIGVAKYFDKSYFVDSKDLTVIDVGINRDENNKLCGDVDTLEVEPLVKNITPVPGGVGVLTVVNVTENLIKTKEL